jgi:hypothetical protein
MTKLGQGWHEGQILLPTGAVVGAFLQNKSLIFILRKMTL